MLRASFSHVLKASSLSRYLATSSFQRAAETYSTSASSSSTSKERADWIGDKNQKQQAEQASSYKQKAENAWGNFKEETSSQQASSSKSSDSNSSDSKDKSWFNLKEKLGVTEKDAEIAKNDSKSTFKDVKSREKERDSKLPNPNTTSYERVHSP